MDVSSEDSQENIREWIVSQGKDYYERIWNNPELIPKYEDIQFDEIMSYRAEFVYEEKFGEEMPNTTDERGYPIYNDIDL